MVTNVSIMVTASNGVLLQIACRCNEKLEKTTTDKVAQFCQVDLDQVVAVHDVASTYHVPLLLEEQGLIRLLHDILKLDEVRRSSALLQQGIEIWTQWKILANSQVKDLEEVSIALVGKYTKYASTPVRLEFILIKRVVCMIHT